MAIPVKLADVVGEMDVPNEEWAVYLNKRTGEIGPRQATPQLKTNRVI